MLLSTRGHQPQVQTSITSLFATIVKATSTLKYVTMMILSCIGAPSKLRGIGDLVYDNKNMPAMNIRVSGGDVIGPSNPDWRHGLFQL
jgi:hypothetical protein